MNSQVIDFIIQFTSSFGLLVGIWLTGNRRLSGPFLCLLAEVAVTIMGVTHGTWSLVVIGVGLGIVQARNFVKWYKEGVAW